MKKSFYPFILSIMGMVTFSSQLFAQTTVKKIMVTVTDAATKNRLDGISVKLTGIRASQTKKTDDQGNAYFDWELNYDDEKIKMEVSESWPASHSPFTTTFIISRNQDQYNLVAEMKSITVRFNFTVIDDETKEPVSNAKVTILIADGRGNTGFTDASGSIYLDIEMLSHFPFVNVDAAKDGYSTSEKMVELQPDTKTYTVRFSLLRTSNVRNLKVTVWDQDNKPVPDASVQAQGPSIPDLYTGTTNASGVANILCKTAGKFTVTVRHENFQPAQQEIVVNVYGDKDISASFVLKRKKGLLRDVTVKVKDAVTGKPIPRASVDAKSFAGVVGGVTDKNGEVYLKSVVALGETGELTIIADGYEYTITHYVGGGENYRYSPPMADNVYVSLKKEIPKYVKLIIQVLNKATERPIGHAMVSMKDKNGKSVFSNEQTNVKAQFDTVLSIEELKNAPFRIFAKASGYVEHWSDLTSDFINTDNERLVFSIYLEEKKAAQKSNEKKYGPFSVPSSRWVSTGISFKKGDYFRVEASGYFTTKDGQKIGPEGGGYWTWWTLAGKIGKQQLYVSRAGGGSITEDGVLELGTPRGLGAKEFIKEDVENLQGNLSVYVFSKAGTWDRAALYNYKEAESDLYILTRIRNQDPEFFSRRTNGEIVQEYRAIVSKYDFPESAISYGTEHCTTLLAHGLVNDKDKKNCQSCLDNTINALKKLMQGMKQ